MTATKAKPSVKDVIGMLKEPFACVPLMWREFQTVSEEFDDGTGRWEELAFWSDPDGNYAVVPKRLKKQVTDILKRERS